MVQQNSEAKMTVQNGLFGTGKGTKYWQHRKHWKNYNVCYLEVISLLIKIRKIKTVL